MTKVLIPIADGSEEIEAMTMIDVLRRAEVDVVVASVMPDTLTVTLSRGVKVEADCNIADCAQQTFDMIALPGGMPGAENLQHSKPLQGLIQMQLSEQKWLAAICASPAVALGRNGYMSDYKATCYPGFRDELANYAKQVSDDQVVIDGELITSQGPGTAMVFSLTLAEQLLGKALAKSVAEALLFDY